MVLGADLKLTSMTLQALSHRSLEMSLLLQIELSIIEATRVHCKVTFPLSYPLLLGGQWHL